MGSKGWLLLSKIKGGDLIIYLQAVVLILFVWLFSIQKKVRLIVPDVKLKILVILPDIEQNAD